MFKVITLIDNETNNNKIVGDKSILISNLSKSKMKIKNLIDLFKFQNFWKTFITANTKIVFIVLK